VDDFDGIGRRLPHVARSAIGAHLSSGSVAQAEPDRSLPRLPVFVTLRDREGALRGCVGSLIAIETDVVRETARSAVLAATRDPRFPAVAGHEIGALRIEVSVLLPDEPAQNPDDLDPRRYGVIVSDGSGRRGLLLPDIPGLSDARTQIAAARRKAGIPDGVSVEVRRFEVLKFGD
jgi:MEMO1 family protein